MDTSSNLNFSIKEMEESDFPENRELAERARRVIYELIKQLKPVLRYVSQTMPTAGGEFRGVLLGKNPKTLMDRVLFLTEDGNFMTVDNSPPKNVRGEQDFARIVPQWAGRWTEYPVDYLLEQLQCVFRKAEEKRKEHLVSIVERRAKLDKIMEILKS